ncbi:hypothetical protein PC39_08394 [Salinisphaera sp. PC39]
MRYQAHGKGSHGRLYYGNRFTTLKDRKKPVGKGLLKAMCVQLGVDADRLEERMAMRYVYPVTIEADEDGRHVASAGDVPEALTEGASIAEALHAMSDALGAALAGYDLAGRALPVPGEPEPGQYLVPVPALVAAKLSLRGAMRAEGLSNVALAARMGVSEGAVRRLVDPDHASRLDGVVKALAQTGHGLIIEDYKETA